VIREIVDQVSTVPAAESCRIDLTVVLRAVAAKEVEVSGVAEKRVLEDLGLLSAVNSTIGRWKLQSVH